MRSVSAHGSEKLFSLVVLYSYAASEAAASLSPSLASGAALSSSTAARLIGWLPIPVSA